MDSNSIAQLVAAFKESQVAAPAISQNGVVIATMITALVGQMFLQLLGYLKSSKAEEYAKAASIKGEEAAEELKKIHTAVNSGTEVGKVKMEGLEKKVLELLQEKATTDEKQRVQTTKDAVAAASSIQPTQPLSDAAVAQLVDALRARRSEPEITKGL